MSLSAEERRQRRRQRLLLNQEDRMKRIFGVQEVDDDGNEKDTTFDKQNIPERISASCPATVLPRQGLRDTQSTGSLEQSSNTVEQDTTHEPMRVHQITHVDVHSTNKESDATSTDQAAESNANCIYDRTDDDLNHCLTAGEMIVRKRNASNLQNDVKRNHSSRGVVDNAVRSSESKSDSNISNSSSSHELSEMELYESVFGKADVKRSRSEMLYLNVKYVLCMLAGLFVRLSLSTSFGTQYVQTIFYPFVALEIALHGYVQAAQMETSPGKLDMFVAALMLSGISADVINKYRKAMRMFSLVLEDLAYYFFSFVVTHVIIELITG